MLSYNDAWLLLLLTFLIVSPAILLLRRPRGRGAPGGRALTGGYIGGAAVVCQETATAPVSRMSHAPAPSSLLPLGLALAAACSSDMGPGPADPGDGSRLAAEFENLADEVGDSGATASANALRHAAQVVRLVGHATPVSVTIDGVRHG